MNTRNSILLQDLNNILTCPLCLGYYVDATTLVDCMHSFCKSCILKHFENNKIICPTCNTACKRKENFSYYKQDMQLQTLVYKIVPGLYAKEIQRREDFYRTAGVRASSSCSDDSVIGDNMQEHEEWIHTIGDENQFLSPDDSISLSLEYYQQHLDNSSSQKTPDRRKSETITDSSSSSSSSNNNNNNSSKNSDCSERNTDNLDNSAIGGDKITDDETDNNKVQSDSNDPNYKPKEEKVKDRRYLQCPAAVSMTHLQKFIRMKYALSMEHKVDIIHDGEVLSSNFTLMDVAYTFKWRRDKPMRFFYRIFTPMKIRPIRIINTSSSGPKQLQIVPVNSNPIQESKTLEAAKKSPAKETSTSSSTLTMIENEENSKEKARLMAELQLQSKAKLMEQTESSNILEKNIQISRYGRTYERNHDIPHTTTSEKRKRDSDESERKEEVVEKKKKVPNERVSPKFEKKKRDIEEDNTCVFDYEEQDKEELKRFAEKRDREWQMIKHSEDEPRPYKKRKKNKHSRGDKRKLHAEITSEVSNKQESIKLKVKLTPHNGHKHKHHKTQTEGVELSSKEKLRQMRQIRHKMISVEEKVQKVIEDKAKKEQGRGEYTITLAKTTSETQTRTSEVQTKTSETQTKSSETQTTSKEENKEKGETLFSGKTLRSDFVIKTNASKELCSKQAIVQTERLEQIEKLIPKNNPRMVYSKSDKQQSKIENIEKKTSQSTKSLQQQISLLQQQCSVKPAEIKKIDAQKQEKKVKFTGDKPRILNSQYPSGFTVSKVEAGVKKKQAEDTNHDKRPSLEITLINPQTTDVPQTTVTAPKQSPSTATKRPLPATIPLERIKSIKAITTLSGISIIPKVSEKCDNIGALDLSKPNRSAESKVELNKNGLNPNGNGLKPITTSSADKGPLSNLQMLSKVATEHPNINKSINVQNKARGQMPSLQNIKVPNLSNSQTNKSTNLAKLPKLNEINKGQFRMTNSPRTMRPTQNQSIRNIPNPSLLVRQQNQNRMNSLSLASNSNEKDHKSSVASAALPENEKKQEKQKTVEKCDIPVSKT